MLSSDLSNFSSWQKWNREAVRKAPNLPGVYAFRLGGSSFGRFRGTSDLVYIGRTDADGTICRRLRDHLSSDADAARRLRDAQTVGELEVSWKITTGGEAAKEEAKLLRNYIWDHLELPPANRSEPDRDNRLMIEAAANMIQTSDQFKQVRCDSPKEARELAEKLLEYLHEEKLQNEKVRTTSGVTD